MAAAVAGLLSAMTPPWRGRLATVEELLSATGPRVADGLVAASSIGLLLLARGLARRRHRSWQAAVALLFAGVVLHLLKGLDVEEAGFDLVVLGLLLRWHKEFDAEGDPAGPPRAWRTGLVLFGGLYVYGAVALATHDVLRRRGLPSLPHALREVSYGLVGQDVAAHPGRFEHGLTLSLAAAAIVFAAYVLWLAVRPREGVAGHSPADRADARRLVEAHGSDTLAYFALRRDKAYFFDESRTAFVAYRAAGGVALASGDPIGAPSAFPALIRGFADFAHAHAWRVVVLGAGGERLDDWATIGLRSLYIGDEAIVRPGSFSLEGRPIRKVRQSVNRLRKADYHTRCVAARELDASCWAEIDHVSHSWLRGQPERGFSMALDDMHAPEHGDARFALALGPDGRLAGFLHLVPVPATGGLSLSAMRRLPETPNGLMEFLLCETFLWGREHGVPGVSLNFNAFGELMRADRDLGPWQRVVRWVLSRADRFFQVERLLDFNRKFFPEWQPRYVAFERYADVPLGALVTLSVEEFVVWPQALRRLWPRPAS